MLEDTVGIIGNPNLDIPDAPADLHETDCIVIAELRRLKGSTAHWVEGSYAKVLKKFKTELDQALSPSIGPDGRVLFGDFDEERFFEVLKSLKGKWLMTYGIRGKLPKLLKDAGFHIKRISTPRTIGAMRGVGGPSVLTQLLVANYKFVEKHEGTARGVAAGRAHSPEMR